MSNRQQRRRFLAAKTLMTYLCEPDDPALVGLLKNAVTAWINLIAVDERHCIACGSRVASRRDLGFVLLSAPAKAKVASASCCGICRDCAQLPPSELERAVSVELQQLLPLGQFESLDGVRHRLPDCRTVARRIAEVVNIRHAERQAPSSRRRR